MDDVTTPDKSLEELAQEAPAEAQSKYAANQATAESSQPVLDEIVRGHCITSASASEVLIDQLKRELDNQPIDVSRQPTPSDKGLALTSVEPPWVTSARSSHADSDRGRGMSCSERQSAQGPRSSHTTDDERLSCTSSAVGAQTATALAADSQDEIESEIPAVSSASAFRRASEFRSSENVLDAVPEGAPAGEPSQGDSATGRVSQRRLSLGSLARAATTPNLGGIVGMGAQRRPPASGVGKTDFEAHQQTAAARAIVEMRARPRRLTFLEQLAQRMSLAPELRQTSVRAESTPSSDPEGAPNTAPVVNPKFDRWRAAGGPQRTRGSATEVSGSLKGVLPVSRAGGPASSASPRSPHVGALRGTAAPVLTRAPPSPSHHRYAPPSRAMYVPWGARHVCPLVARRLRCVRLPPGGHTRPLTVRPSRAADFDCYQFEEDESRVHFEMREERWKTQRNNVLCASISLVIVMGIVLGCISFTITYCELNLRTNLRDEQVTRAFDYDNNDGRPTTDAVVTAWAAYTGFNCLYILLAATLTYFAPLAALSGLPPVKAYLNGVNVPNLLTLRTLVAKVAGVTLVVSSGLPLGREGPMVHTGAIVAARITRAKIPYWLLPFCKPKQQDLGHLDARGEGAEKAETHLTTPIELRVPSAQRNWVGIGCAAGVAAAFNAPLGGILYSFEEVCSHWTEKMTWRAFFCCVVAAFTFNIVFDWYDDANDGALIRGGLVLSLDVSAGLRQVEYPEFLFIAIIGVLGGMLGALYVRGVVGLNALRRRIFKPPRVGSRWFKLRFRAEGRPPPGAALASEALATELRSGKRRFTGPELDALQLSELTHESYILVDGAYYKPAPRSKARIYEAVLLSFVVFTIFFFFPFFFECSDVCPGEAGNGSGSGSGSGNYGRMMAEAAGSGCAGGSGSASGRRLAGDFDHEPVWASAVRYGRRLAGGGGAPPPLRWNCPAGQTNHMASLMHNGQEGIILNMLSRDLDVQEQLTWHILLPFMIMYIVVAIGIFGIQVPAGNFIPALTLGSGMGRLFAEFLVVWGVKDAFGIDTPAGAFEGSYALLGAAAVLGGVTRMTLTLAAILIEVTDDAPILLEMMFVLILAKVVADYFSHGFDHAMIHLQHLPFLDEEPPAKFAVFTAQDVMARSVVALREVEHVGDLVAVLKRTPHNGFPVVDVGKRQRCAFFAGLILRRQLLVLLREKVWLLQNKGDHLPLAARMRYADSALSSHTTHRLLHEMVLSEEDKLATLDLRPFMDPSPYVVNELMPLRRVYRLFNEIGVRHLTVVDCREQVVGIITRKDILPHHIEHKLLQDEEVKRAEKVIQLAKDERRFSSALGKMTTALGKVTGMRTSDTHSHNTAGRRDHAPESPEGHSPDGGNRRSSHHCTTRRGEDHDTESTTIQLQCGEGVLETHPQQHHSYAQGQCRPSAASLASSVSARSDADPSDVGLEQPPDVRKSRSLPM